MSQSSKRAKRLARKIHVRSLVKDWAGAVHQYPLIKAIRKQVFG